VSTGQASASFNPSPALLVRFPHAIVPAAASASTRRRRRSTSALRPSHRVHWAGSGFDVDKLDYFMRDRARAVGQTLRSPERFLQLARCGVWIST
jgi:hypothetical protein